MSNGVKRTIAISEDSYCDYNFKYGHFIPIDPDEVPQRCDPAYQYAVDTAGMIEGLLPDLWTEQYGKKPESNSNDDILNDLKKDWIIIPIRTVFSPYLEFEFLPLSISNLYDCDAVYIVNKSDLDCSEEETMRIIEKDFEDFASFFNAQRWRVWLYKNGTPEKLSVDGNNEMVLIGSLDEILPKVRDILPEEYLPLWDAGQYELDP